MSTFIVATGKSPLRQKAIIALGEILREAIIEAMRLEGTKDIDTVTSVEVPRWLFEALGAVQKGGQPVQALGRPVHYYVGGVDSIRVFFADNTQPAGGPVATHCHELMMLPDSLAVMKIEELIPKTKKLEATFIGDGRMSFGAALEYLKYNTGARVCRAGWDGKGMWLTLVHHKTAEVDHRSAWFYVVAANFPDAYAVTPAPWIGMKTADNKFVPWLASQTDILAEDWEIV